MATVSPGKEVVSLSHSHQIYKGHVPRTEKRFHQERWHLFTPAAVNVGSQGFLKTAQSSTGFNLFVRTKKYLSFFVTIIMIQQNNYQPWPVEGKVGPDILSQMQDL